jgi:predicted nucleic acid-binding protein
VGVYSLDTSAVVKRYVSETGSVWMNALCDPASGNSLHIARITAVEVVSALARRHRKGDIDHAGFDTLIARFQFDLRTQYQVVEIGPALIDEAMRLATAHALRGYDAVQLAALSSVQATLKKEQLPLPTLVAADHDLLVAAIAEGFKVEDPNTH